MIEEARKIAAEETLEGAGVRVKRLFPVPGFKNLDPFVLLDEFFVEPKAGFPTHPHRGFEALTYMLEGSFCHQDNLGNDTEVFPGGVQRFTAGRGLYHSEMPGSGPMNHGLQLWINLPSDLKGMEPGYEQYDAERIPKTVADGYTVRTIVGENSPVILNTSIICQDIMLDEGYSLILNRPDGFDGIIYVYEGELIAADTTLAPGEALLTGGGLEVSVKGQKPSGLIHLAGKPHGEPIRQLGPFVD